MSQFEFISVAQSLVCSLIAARVLSLFACVGSRERSYAVHTAWVFCCLASVTTNWWLFWSFVDVSWTYPRFVLSLSPTAFVYMMAATMAPTDPGAVLSWRDHYFENKKRFFLYGAGWTASTVASQYFLLGLPLLRTQLPVAIVFAVVTVAGISSRSHRVHALLVGVWALVFLFAASGMIELDLRVPLKWPGEPAA